MAQRIRHLTTNQGISGQRESFFQFRDENESFSDSISFIETRPRIPDTYSQASRRDREKISSNLGHRDEIEIYYLHSQTSRREREFPWSDLVFRDETENSETCHLSLKSGLNGLTILHAIFGRLTILNAGPHILLDVLPFWNDPVMFFGQVYCDFFDCCHKCHNIECFESQILVSHLTAVQLNFELQHFPVRQLPRIHSSQL